MTPGEDGELHFDTWHSCFALRMQYLRSDCNPSSRETSGTSTQPRVSAQRVRSVVKMVLRWACEGETSPPPGTHFERLCATAKYINSQTMLHEDNPSSPPHAHIGVLLVLVDNRRRASLGRDFNRYGLLVETPLLKYSRRWHKPANTGRKGVKRKDGSANKQPNNKDMLATIHTSPPYLSG